MHIIEDEIDHVYYLDIILSGDDVRKIHKNEMISGSITINKKRFYIGIRLAGEWDDEEERERESED